MTKLRLDIENEQLKNSVKNLFSKIDYPLRFNHIKISTSYKTDFIGGEADEDMEIIINPESRILEHNFLFNGYFARFVFMLIDEKEKVNQEIKEKLEVPKLVEFVQNFFADLKAVKYGFKQDMHRFFLEKISKKIYKTESVSKEEYLEFYSYHLIFKKIGEEGEIKSLLELVKVQGLDNLLRELEKLNYPFFLGDENLKKAWVGVFDL
ncbi:MAG: hypothetical protein DRP06_00190 [Candidatus Aenigmatarchaeota archaeon]|nr:MAG: hypothetical protein DRP06_00190 [Candidatus Aenigmarchaeota archaeon]